MTNRQKQLVENYIRNSVRKVLKESTEIDLTKISTEVLKQMLIIMGKNLPKATEDDKKMLRAIQMEWGSRQDK